MLRRPVTLVVLVPLVTLLAVLLIDIGLNVELRPSRMLAFSLLTSGGVAAVLASRDHGPVRAGAIGIGAAAMCLVLVVVFFFMIIALAGDDLLE